MNPIDVVKAGMAAVEAGQMDKYANMIADDMVFAGPAPRPLDKQEFIQMLTALTTAMPDWKFNAADFRQDGEKVITTVQITGTQTGELSLPMAGLSKIPPTGKRVALPPQETTYTVMNGKLARVDAMPDPKNGVPGILSQLGISMPSMPQM